LRSAVEITIEEVIDRIDDWKQRKVTFEVLGGGITNHNYKVSVDGENYVVRIPGAETELFIDRENELDCSVAAGKTGVAPEVVHHLKPENVSVFQFIQARTLSTGEIASDNKLVERIVQSIRVIHDNASFKRKFDPFETVRMYMDRYIPKYNVLLPDDIEWMLSLNSDIETAMQTNKPREVACHNDYLSENFMDDGENIWIIDWEYGGEGDPYFDLGDFAVEHPFSRDQEELIIRNYCDGLEKEKLYRMLLYKIVSDLWWGLWAMIQHKVSKIDFDFYTYANNRFERLRKNARDNDYEKWLEQV
jgi:thiamine kinase-like enzyme